MRAAGLVEEHRRALLATRYVDLHPLIAAGITWKTIAAIASAKAQITVVGATYEPDPDGGAAYLIPERADNALTPEAVDRWDTIQSGAVVDIVAIHPRHLDRWALRRDAAEWLGAIEPQYLDPEPVAVWRSPLGWLRPGCRGIVVLSQDAACAYRVLTMCRAGIIAEDAVHAAELRRFLVRPWPIPRIIIPGKRRHAASSNGN
jgi:hypothetical protein